MSENSVFLNKRMVGALHKLFVDIDSLCSYAGDIHLAEYALLSMAVEKEQGLSFKRITSLLDSAARYSDSTEVLEAKELVSRIRDTEDRRGFALSVTQKGKIRAALLDNALALSLAAANDRMSEETLEYLVTKMHAFANAIEPSFVSNRLFPSSALDLIHSYVHIATKGSSVFGLTAMQIAMLCDLESLHECATFAATDNQPTYFEAVARYELEDLEEKDFLHTLGTIHLHERGLQRCKEFSRKVDPWITLLLEQYPDSARAPLEELGECILFLFA